jgi:MFS transporter, YNFM family, putative membrane transport protein
MAHLRSPRLVATYAVGFSILFSLVATFTYVNFYLGEPPFSLGPGLLSSIFVVYLVGIFITPVAGKWIDRYGSRLTLAAALAASVVIMPLTMTKNLALVAVGLAACSSAVFVCQSASTSYLQHAAPLATRSSAAGLYVAFYYLGGSVGGELPGLLWRWGGWPGCVALVIGAQLATIAVAWRFWS